MSYLEYIPIMFIFVILGNFVFLVFLWVRSRERRNWTTRNISKNALPHRRTGEWSTGELIRICDCGDSIVYTDGILRYAWCTECREFQQQPSKPECLLELAEVTPKSSDDESQKSFRVDP